MSLKELLKKNKKTSGRAIQSSQIATAQVLKNTEGARFFGGRYTNQLGYNDLLDAESALGRTIFGPVPAGHQREFFAYKKNVWLWYERWTDAAGAMQEMTVRYEVRPAGVFKRPTGGSYTKLEGAELDNFCRAARTYFDLVKKNLYYN